MHFSSAETVPSGLVDGLNVADSLVCDRDMVFLVMRNWIKVCIICLETSLVLNESDCEEIWMKYLRPCAALDGGLRGNRAGGR